MNKTKYAWLLCLTLAACASDHPAPVIDRLPTAKSTPAKPAPKTAKAKSATPAKGKDTRPDSYIVKKGDTLYSIGLEFGYDYRDIAQANHISPPYPLYVGQKLDFRSLKSGETKTVMAEKPATAAATTEGDVVIRPLSTPGSVAPATAQPEVQATPLPAPAPLITGPKAIRQPYSLEALNAPPPTEAPQSAATPAPDATKPVETAKPAENATPPADNNAAPAAAAAEASDWAWPAQGKVIKGFSESGTARGIDIAGKMGEPVTAAGPGKVIYSGEDLRGYGKLVIIKHDSTFLSVYAHNSKILVKEGQQVAKGQKIAEMGNTDTDQVKLHFEIRQQGKSVDPMKFLPGNSG
ncbi:MAG TPA: peptidoglycan DD-metalloendopeptidase family protein [Methylophilaceae bacterium]|nr:peptidoglycan DD-metalloendopeptidase family protein [Methylophilaceae bacterium]